MAAIAVAWYVAQYMKSQETVCETYLFKNGKNCNSNRSYSEQVYCVLRGPFAQNKKKIFIIRSIVIKICTNM